MKYGSAEVLHRSHSVLAAGRRCGHVSGVTDPKTVGTEDSKQPGFSALLFFVALLQSHKAPTGRTADAKHLAKIKRYPAQNQS